MFGWIFPSANFSGVDSIYLLTRLAALLIPGTATLARFARFARFAVQFSNRRFVIWDPLVINKIKIVVVAIAIAGSGCATIIIIVAIAIAGGGCATITIFVFRTAQNVIITIMETNIAYIQR